MEATAFETSLLNAQRPDRTQMVDVSIIIVNWNTRQHLRRCLTSIYTDTEGATFEVFVIDNASSDDSAQMIRQAFPQAQLIANPANIGFARACNQGLRRAAGRYVLLLNPDTWLLGDALGQMVSFLDHQPSIGALGPRIVDVDGSLDPRCARRYPSLRSELWEKLRLDRRFPRSPLFGSYLMTYWDHQDSREVDALSGACMIVRRDAIEEVGLLDEDFFMYGEDIEYCHRIKQAGWRIFFYAEPTIVHLGRQSSRLITDRMGLQALKSMHLFFLKTRSPSYAAAYRMLILGLSTVKQVTFAVARFASPHREARHDYYTKVRLHRSIRKWARTAT